ncbi:MAG: MerR family transcriptional regulator [Desulfuromusa sp.]|jgi:DNA-binding transcriptional MerR regulator|nr:MerR family transcriptional regulator [Desulfuromusa sp.]
MINIKQLSQEVSIGVDTLRIWERRYGFPRPERDSRGHRCYPEEQVEELRVIKGLQLLGFRPSKIFKISAEERIELLRQKQSSGVIANETLRQLALEFGPKEIDHELHQQLQSLGLEGFIQQTAVPLIQVLDHAWANGSISIAREHLVSDQLEALLKEQLRAGEPDTDCQQMLFLTLSGERHKLGLLLSAVLFQRQGIGCTFLNEEIPLSEVPQLAEDLGVAAVALSFSAHYSSRQAKKDLASLRNTLSPQIKLIAGGYAVRQGVQMANLFICSGLEKIPDLSKKIFSANS